MLVAGLALKRHPVDGGAGMLRDGEGAAAGDVRHEKGGAFITGPGELLAAAYVVVAVPEQEMRCGQKLPQPGVPLTNAAQRHLG